MFSGYSNLLCRCHAAPLLEARLGAISRSLVGEGRNKVHLSVLLFDNKIVYIEASLTVSKMRSNILRHISHTRYHSAAMPLLSLHHRCTLSSCGKMKGCTVVSFMEEKLSIFGIF